MKFIDNNGKVHQNPLRAALEGFRGRRPNNVAPEQEAVDMESPIKVTVAGPVGEPEPEDVVVEEEVQQQQDESRIEEAIRSQEAAGMYTGIDHPIPVMITDENGNENVGSIRITEECVRTARRIYIRNTSDRLIQMMNIKGEIVMVSKINDGIELDFPEGKEIVTGAVLFPNRDLIKTTMTAENIDETIINECINVVCSLDHANPIDSINEVIQRTGIQKDDLNLILAAYSDLVRAGVWLAPYSVINTDVRETAFHSSIISELDRIVMDKVSFKSENPNDRVYGVQPTKESEVDPSQLNGEKDHPIDPTDDENEEGGNEDGVN